MGFKKQIDDILKRIKDKLNENNNITSLSQLENEEENEEVKEEIEDNKRQYQTILCSATLNDDIIRLASSLLTNPKYIFLLLFIIIIIF